MAAGGEILCFTMLQHISAQDMALRLLLSLGAGLLIGLEREWSNKDAGARTFAITALLGMLSALISLAFSIAALAGILVLIGFLNVRRLIIDKTLEVTTSVVLVLTFVLGVLIGQGRLFEPVAAAILTTILLTWKVELTNFASRLRPEEIRSAVLLGLLSFVIYPLLPNRIIDPWGLLNPREFWVTIIVIASIGFVNYVLLRLWSTRGFNYTAILGGLVNSTATIAELTAALGGVAEAVDPVIAKASLLTIFAMFSRNLLLLALLYPPSVRFAALPLLAMAGAAALFARLQPAAPQHGFELKISSPISLRRLSAFGALFFAIEAAGVLAERHLGRSGFFGTSLISGILSSASATAAAANLGARGQVGRHVAAVAAVLASMVSAATNLNWPLIFRPALGSRGRARMLLPTVGVLAAGFAAILIQRFA